MSSGTVWNPSIKVCQNLKKKKESETCNSCYISVAMTGSELKRESTDKLHHQHDFERPWTSMSHMELLIWICLHLSKPFTAISEMYVWNMDGCGWNNLYIYIITVIAHFWGGLRMWITNETSHSIYLAVKTHVNSQGHLLRQPPNPTRLIPQLNNR